MKHEYCAHYIVNSSSPFTPDMFSCFLCSVKAWRNENDSILSISLSVRKKHDAEIFFCTNGKLSKSLVLILAFPRFNFKCAFSFIQHLGHTEDGENMKRK